MGLEGLDGRVVLVTGGASGIGRATVDRLVEEGARVAIADVNAEGIERAVAEYGEERVLGVTTDVSKEADVEAAFAAAIEGAPDVRVNGVIPGPIDTPLLHGCSATSRRT